MIIDTNELRKAITTYFDNEAEKIDINVKDDRTAFKLLTQSEERQCKEEQAVSYTEQLYSGYSDKHELNTDINDLEGAVQIVKALKSDELFDVKISHRDKWLYYDDTDRRWTVLERKPYVRGNNVVIRTTDLAAAVKKLVEEDYE